MNTKIIFSIFITALFSFWGMITKGQPNWDVEPGDFVYSMTITGKITTDGYFSTDEDDVIAAFIDGECRGVSKVEYVSAVDAYYVFLMVYSNDPAGTVTFKIYDDSANEEFTVKETINFTVNDIIGSVSNPFIFSASTLGGDARMLSFTIPNQEGETVISGNNVYLEEHWSGDLTGITPNFTLSEGAKAYVGGVEQTSGVNTHDFLVPVEYTVESADLSTSTVYTVYITEANDIPTDILLTSQQKEENDPMSFIGAFSTVTANPEEEHVYSLVSAPQTANEYFYIDGSGLRSRNPFDYEQRSSYRIKVRADDQKGGVVEKFFTIEILDQNDPPTDIALANANTPVNTSPNTVIGNLLALDDDPDDHHVFTLVEGDGSNDRDNRHFRIQGNELIAASQLVFLEGTEYHIRVRVEDAQGASLEVSLVLSTETHGNPPHSLELSSTLVLGTEDPPLLVGTLTTQDVDQESGHGFSLSPHETLGVDNGYFSIVNGALYLDDLEPVEEKMRYSVFIAVTDSMGNSFTRGFEIRVRDQLGSGAFYLSEDHLSENQPLNTIVGYFDSESYPSEEYSFSLPLEVDLETYCNDEFRLNGRTLLTNKVFDYELEHTLMLRLEVSDGETRITEDVVVHITDENDPPTGLSLSANVLSESTGVNTVAGTLSAEDQDAGDSHTFSLAMGNGMNDASNDYFEVDGNSLVLKKALDYEEQEYHNILLKVTDSGGAIFEQGLRLRVADANDAPEIVSEPVNYVLQNDVYVYAIKAEDSEGDEVTFSFEGLPEWLTFNSATHLLTGVAGNDWVGEYSFIIRVSDGQKSSEQQVLLSVINENDPPEVNYYLGEQTFFTNRDNEVILPSDAMIDPDVGDTLTYSLSLENNSSLPGWLTFDPVTLQLTGNPPYEAYGVHSLKLMAKDQGNLKEWMVFNLHVTYPTSVNDPGVLSGPEIYPNPVRNHLNISVPAGKEDARIGITDGSGKQIRLLSLPAGTRKTLSVEGLKPGVYFLRFNQGENHEVRKVIKQ